MYSLDKLILITCIKYIRMKKLFFSLGLFLISILYCGHSFAQDVALKTNFLFWNTLSPNLGIEYAFNNKKSIDLFVSYNPWNLHDNRKFKHLLIQPELRFWRNEKFNGSFLGIHTHYGLNNISWPNITDYRWQGWFIGGGISYGYQWILNDRWRLEAEIGIGYARFIQDKYEIGECGNCLGREKINYWGPTKLGLNITYILK